MSMSITKEEYEPIDVLELCPFCSNQVKVSRCTNHLAGNGRLSIECCDEMVEYFILDGNKHKKKDSEAVARFKLIAKWNTRYKNIGLQ